MSQAEAKGVTGAALQKVEDDWTTAANLQLYNDTLAAALKAQGVNPAKFLEEAANASNNDSLKIAQRHGLRNAPFWDWSAPRTREGYFRYRGGTKCAINRAIAFAPHAGKYSERDRWVT
jgi:isocitrate lyase